MKTIEIAGQKFGRLKVLHYVGKDRKRQALWECICDCGNRHVAAGCYLRSGNIKSCGCLQPETASAHCKESFTTHGITRTLTGVSWTSMMQRCFNPKVKHWMDYGGRGIRPCEFVAATPLNLVVLIGFRPSKDVSLDRLNNAVGYTCGSCRQCIEHDWPMNVRWATRLIQNRNKRISQMVEIGGVRKSVGEWAEEWNVPYTTARYRIWKHRKEVIQTVENYDI
jgi:hypothetical protein